MEENIKYNKYNFIQKTYLRNNDNLYDINRDNIRSYNNYDKQYNYINNIDNYIEDSKESRSNEKRNYLISEINELKKKYLMAKEKLEMAKNQKVKDVKYIKDLEKEIFLKNKYNNNPNRNENLLNKRFIKIPKKNQVYHYERNTNNNANNSLYYNNKSFNNSIIYTNNNQRIKNSKPNITDFSLYSSSYKNSNKKTTNDKTHKNTTSQKISSKISPMKKLKRNNSVILNDGLLNNYKKNLNTNDLDIFTFNQNSKNEENNNEKNKIIIRNCNLIINLNPENPQNSKFLSVFNKINTNNNILSKRANKKYNNDNKKESKQIMQERFLIIDQKQKSIYINGKQVLGMNLMPLKGDNNEIILDNDNNIFLYDLNGSLHSQKDLTNILLDNGLPLVNENNIPILGINNVPIVDQYGDFLLDKGPVIDSDDNYINGVYADILRDREGKPLKILIEKKTNTISENKSFNCPTILKKNNPIFEIEINPYSKLITKKDKNYHYYLKKSQKNFNSSNKEKNKFNFEKSLRSYNTKSNSTIKKH